MKFAIAFFVGILLTSCVSTDTSNAGDIHFECDAERLQGENFIAGEFEISSLKATTQLHAKSGKNAVRVNANNQYSLVYELNNIKKGDAIRAEVWRFLDGDAGYLVISADESLYQSNGSIDQKVDNWGRLVTLAVADRDYKKLKIYVLNATQKFAYFDDLKVDIYVNTKKPKAEENDLKIEMSDSALDSLSQFRKSALDKGIITEDSKEYVTGFIAQNGNKIPISVRLKGDWTDHLDSDKWSLRIKVEGDFAFNGLKTFSIQSPETRGYLREWFAHQLFEHEDILTTDYTFIPMSLNGEQMGVYAIEEHFDKQLLEKRKRREAPIVKFDEQGIWQQYVHVKQTGYFLDAPTLPAADISLFKENRTFKSATLHQQFQMAKSHMERYRNLDENLNEYMDVERIAKYLALTDILNGKHGSIWHNQRFYFNPITLKLEVIAYDCFTNQFETQMPPIELLGLVTKNATRLDLNEFLVENPAVSKRYLHYLKVYSKREFFNSVFRKIQPELSKMETVLKHEYPFCDVEKEMFLYQADEARKLIPMLEQYSNQPKKVRVNSDEHFRDLPKGVLFEGIALKAFPLSENGEKQIIELRNFHLGDIDVFGYSVKGKKGQIIQFKNEYRIKKYKDGAPKIQIEIPIETKKIYYRASNCGTKIFDVKLSKWKVTDEINGPQQSIDFSQVPFSEKGNILFLRRGNYQVKKDVIIPEGKLVKIEAGTTIDLTNSACFISYSPVIAEGTTENKIKIYSSDHSANGFTIIAENQKSKLHFVEFEGLKSLNKLNASLTGAVTIYSGIVEINGCTFTNNKCEDGVNLIRCSFVFRNSEVKNTTSDGFDADFCSGVVVNSKFSNTGNDCVDFSGSVITIENCTFKKSGDKAISGGEKSKLIVNNCSIDGASIAIASKDLSNVEINKVSILNAKIGFACYRKKPEYGPAKIKVNSMKVNRAKKLHLLEDGSSLNYLGKKWEGKEHLDIDAMYAQFEK